MKALLASTALLALSAVACSSNEQSTTDSGATSMGMDAGLADALVVTDMGQAVADAGMEDSSVGDTGTIDSGLIDMGMDAGQIDTGPMYPLPGFGTISGDCDALAQAVTSTAPSFFLNHIDFGADPFDDPADLPKLTEGGREIIRDGNAGGSSVLSEVFAYEVLARCEQAMLLKTETEIVYQMQGKITDLLVEIDGRKVGVSVTRAVGFPRDDPYTIQQAEELLADKLADVIRSSQNVAREDAWVKQILHVLAYGPMHGEVLRSAWGMLGSKFRQDTIVVVTVTDGDDAPIY